jgi:hypothetical protein
MPNTRLGLLNSRGSAYSEYIKDLFKDSDGVLIQNHIPDVRIPGSSWSLGSLSNNAWDIYENKLRYIGTATSSLKGVIIESEVYHGIIEGTMISDPLINHHGGLIFRVRDNALSGWMAFVEPGDISNNIGIYDPSTTVRALGTLGMSLGDSIKIHAFFNGPLIRATFTNLRTLEEKKLIYNDTSYLRNYFTTKAGIILDTLTQTPTNARFDNFRIAGFLPATWVPTRISGCVLWLDGRDLTFKTDGVSVDLWQDFSGNNFSATQGTSANRPLKYANIINNRNILRFDNVNDGMVTTCVINSLPFSLYAVYNRTDPTSIERRAVQGSNNWLIGPRTDNHQYYNGALIIGPPIVNEKFVYAGVICSTGNNEFRVNGVSYGNNANNGVPGTIGLGTSGSSGERLAGDIAEIVAFNKALSTSERDQLEAYFKLKYNIW